MRILVTGSAGYVGQPLVARLHAAGHDVVGVDLRAGPFTTTADVRCLPAALFDRVDAVIHLAAISFAPEWNDLDELIWSVNVEGTRHIVQHCEAAGVARLIVASSASVFEGRIHPPAQVSTPTAPESAYGRSKVECERMLATSSIPQRIVVRKGTVCGFGPQPRLDLLTNAMSVNALRLGVVFVDGTGNGHRPILRLERAVCGYAAAATNLFPAGCHTANLCDDNVTVDAVARQICDLTGASLEYRPAPPRSRSYRVVAGRTEGCDFADLRPVSAATIVQDVVREARERIDDLPSTGDDPRVDRLARIRRGAALPS
ncbi:MAG: NAD-dependent epimerase/dehydratase family protein [Actinomycetota bacterium]